MKTLKDKSIEESIRLRLVEAIKTSGHTQAEIAKKVFITSATISDYIHQGKSPSLVTFARICDFLDISADEILGIDKN